MQKNLLAMFMVLMFSLSSSMLFAQPVNDNCADATAIGEVTDLAFDNTMATTDGPNHPMDCVSGGDTPDSIYNDMWYLYTAGFSGLAEWTMCQTADFDTKIAVYNAGTACPVTDGDLYACNEDGTGCANSASVVTFDVVEGESYLLRLGAYGDGIAPAESGTGFFTVSETDPPPPAPDNNLCENATEVMLGPDQPFNTLNAVTTGPEHPTASCFAFGDDFVNDDIFYFFVAPAAATIQWTTCGTSPFDTRMAVYNAGATCPLEDGDLLACNDDGLDADGNPCTGFTSNMTFEVEAGSTYILRLGGYLAGDQGEGTFSLSEIIPEEPPANDDCATGAEQAMVVTPEDADIGVGNLVGTTSAGSQDGGVPSCVNNGEFFDVWYTFNTGDSDSIQTRFSNQSDNLLAGFYMELYTDCMTPAVDTANGGTIPTVCFNYAPEEPSPANDTLTGLTPNTDYWIRVSTNITFDPPGPFWLQLVTIENDIIDGVNDEYTLENVRLFPNPVQQTATVELILEESALTNIEVVNSVGQVIFEQNEGNLSTGTHLIDVNMGNYSSGIYFVRVAADDKQQILKFIKQ